LRKEGERTRILVLNLHEKIVMIGSRVTVEEFLDSFCYCYLCQVMYNQSQSQGLLENDIWDFFSRTRPCFIRVKVKDCGGEAEGRRVTWNEGGQGVHNGNFDIPTGMVARGWTR